MTLVCIENTDYAKKIQRLYTDQITTKEMEVYEWSKKLLGKDLTDKSCQIITDEIALQAAESYKEIQSLVKEKERLRQLLIDKANGQDCIIGNLKIEKKTRKGSIDYKLIPELFFVDLEKYRKPSIEYFEIS